MSFRKQCEPTSERRKLAQVFRDYRLWSLVLAAPLVLVAACSDSGEDESDSGLGSGAATGSGANGSGASGSGAADGSGGTVMVGTGGSAASGGTTGDPSDAGFDACTGWAQEQESISALDIYFVFDRTGSMGTDCAYTHGDVPSETSKACFATYAMADYLIDSTPAVDTRLAFQFMSQPNDCDGTPYETPLVDLTQLPVAEDDPLIQDISDETFQGGLGTHIEGALRGMSVFTAANETAGREMIGVLMTDGDPNGCEEDIGALRDLIADHYAATGIRTFVIGMEGATDANLEELGLAGGAEPHDDWCGSVAPPCHYWNVEDGSGDAIASALQAIIEQSAPLPCSYGVENLEPPAGETVDFGKVNVTLTDQSGSDTTIGQVTDQAACPTDQPAWYYDDPGAPTSIMLCENACDLVSNAANGSHVTVVVGCEDTVVLPPPK